MQNAISPNPAAMGPAENFRLLDGAAHDDALQLPPQLIQYWQALVRSRLLIAGIVSVCVFVAVAVTMLMAPLYTAKTQIQISREQKNITNIEGLEGAVNSNNLEFYATQYGLLKTEVLATRVARSLNLAQSPEFFAAHGVKMPDADAAQGGASASKSSILGRRMRLAARLLLQHVEIAPVRNSSLVTISYVSRSPELSAKIANAWPQAFIEDTLDRQVSSSADARHYLEQRLAGLRAKLEQSEQLLITFGNTHNIVRLAVTRDADGKSSEPRTLVATNLDGLNQALLSARSDRIAAESRLRAGDASSSTEALSSSTISELRNKRAEAAAEYSRLLVQFEPDFPQARALKQQIATLDAAISREVERIRGSRKLVYEEATRRESELERQVQMLKSQFAQQQSDTIQYNIYQREVDTNRQLYDALLQRYKEIGVAGSVGATNIGVVDRAATPTGPSAPSLPKNLALAILAGLGLSALVVFALEQIDEGIRYPSDVEKLLNLPLLGNIPFSDAGPREELANVKSRLSEAYFSVRTTLALATTHGLPRSLVVTSTQPGEGKSITAFALASAIARSGKRALLIDGDLRLPSVHKLAGRGNGEGLSSILAGEDNFQSLISETATKDFWVLTAGPCPPSAAELLSADRLGKVLDLFLQFFDHVIIDAPPVIGLADAPLLARAVEGSLFVIEGRRTTVRAIRNAVKRLRVGNQVYGAVVTKVDMTTYNYGYGYGYQYSYGSD